MGGKVMFIACGSYNPPTPMHLRMFEIAKDHFKELGYEVVGGIISPVHDEYGKKGLVPQTHRLTMLKLALKSSDWIRLSEWETQQEGWSRTKNTLQYHQNFINSIVRDINGINSSNLPNWIPKNICQIKDPIQIKLLCGADLLESFATPDLWHKDDLQAILGQHGIVVITRNGSNLEKFIFDSDLLSSYRRNITIVTNWIANDISSTLARRFISRNLSVKYILDDCIIEYINKHNLYRSKVDDDDNSKYIMPPPLPPPPQSPNTSVTTIDVILTPISLESENSTFNESYVKKQNEKNESSALDDYESMDETDFPPPPPPISKKDSLTADYLSGSPLQKVFCCASSDGTDIRLSRVPGSAVQIHTNYNEEKVGGNNAQMLNECTKSHDDDFGAPDDSNAPTLSPTSPCDDITVNNAQPNDDENETDSESLIASNNSKMQLRFSPKTYDEMIKFVFTEHGIKVISDKEYVV